MMTRVKTDQEIRSMRVSGQILAQVLNYLKDQTEPGVTTKHLAELAAAETKRLGGTTPTLGYEGFPDVICISVNDEVVHGIPGRRVLAPGDLVGFDHCVGYDGMITDAAITVSVGAASEEAKRLLEGTQAGLRAGIKAVRGGVKVQTISRAIEAQLRAHDLGVVEALCGHGVGHSIHEEPEIPNFDTGSPGSNLKVGMTVAVEPMATLGGYQVKMAPDHWTIRTTDGSLAAQFEHTVLVTDAGAEILTALE